METKALLHADYLDIVFDNRNKKYRGYELRKHYPERMRNAAIIALSSLTFLCLYFLWSVNRNTGHMDFPAITAPVKITDLGHEITIPKPPTPPKIQPPASAPAVNTKILTIPKVVTDPDADKPMTPNADMKNANPGTATHDGPSGPPPTFDGPAKGPSTAVTATVPAGPVRYVSQMPTYAGDMDAYLNNHLHYPDAARESGLTGRVLIEFVVNEDGSVTNARVVRGIGGGCDEEALRVVAAMPKWKPGKQNGVPVKVLFTLPIIFSLQ